MQQQCCTASLLYNSFFCLARGKFCASGETQSKNPWGGIWRNPCAVPCCFRAGAEGLWPFFPGAEAPEAQRSRKRTPFIGRWRAFLFLFDCTKTTGRRGRRPLHLPGIGNRFVGAGSPGPHIARNVPEKSAGRETRPLQIPRNIRHGALGTPPLTSPRNWKPIRRGRVTRPTYRTKCSGKIGGTGNPSPTNSPEHSSWGVGDAAPYISPELETDS